MRERDRERERERERERDRDRDRYMDRDRTDINGALWDTTVSKGRQGLVRWNDNSF